MTDGFPACTCITCSDQGVEMVVSSLDETSGLAVCVDESGNADEIDTSLIDSVSVGARLVVHAGVAIALAGEGVAQ